jgi:hypothetical protein
MVSGIAIENLEHVARALGERWARRLHTDPAVPRSAEPWPGSLEQARGLLDEFLGARAPAEHREALALLVERSARACWKSLVKRESLVTGPDIGKIRAVWPSGSG